MAYASWSVVFGEQPSAAKWNILGTNDAYFSSIVDATGMPLQSVSTGFSAVATGTTVLPFDDTIPQITEGVEFMTQAITPKSTTNILVIEAVAMLAHSTAAGEMSMALFQDATAAAIAANGAYQTTLPEPLIHTLCHKMTAGTTSSTTFRIRAGSSAAGTTTFNGKSAGRIYGAIPKSFIRITEYKA